MTCPSHCLTPSYFHWILLLFVVGALLNFLPLFLDGYSMIDPNTNLYPDYIYNLSCFEFTASLVASLATTIPILADYLFYRFLHVVKYGGNSIGGETPNIYVPMWETIAFLLVPDILMLCWLLPYQKYDYMMVLLDARDTMYTFSLLLCLVKFSNSVWTWRSLISIGFPLMINNILLSFSTLTSDLEFVENTITASYVLTSAGLLSFLAHVAYWIWHVLHMSATDVSMRTHLCSAYVVIATVFLLGDWIPSFTTTTPGDPWSTVGLVYLTWYSYLSASCTLCLTVISTSCARMEAIETKVNDLFNSPYIPTLHDVYDLYRVLSPSSKCSCATYRMRCGPR